MTQIPERVSSDKAMTILQSLYHSTTGPREAYGVLALAIWLLNFKISDDPVSIDQLCEEVTGSLRSIKLDNLTH